MDIERAHKSTCRSGKPLAARAGAAVLAVAMAVAVAMASSEGPVRVEVVLSQDGAGYRAWYSALRTRLLASDDTVDVRLRVMPAAGEAATVRVGAGAAASEEVLRHDPSVPAVVALLPHYAVETDPARFAPRRPSPSTAVFQDQPPERYFALIRAAAPDAKRVAVLLGASSRVDRSRLQAAAQRARLALDAAELGAGDNIVKVLEPLLAVADVLLVPPDPDVSNEQNVYPLLLASYRRGIPVIAFSAAYVKAGALAAIYASPEQLGEQAADAVVAFLREDRRRFPPPQYARDFQIDVNRHVARSLGLSIPDEAELHRRIAAEGHAGGRSP